MAFVPFQKYKVPVSIGDDMNILVVACALELGCCKFFACGYCQKGDSCPDNHDFPPFQVLSDKETAVLDKRPQFDNKVEGFTVLQHTAEQIKALLPKGKPFPETLNPKKVTKGSIDKLSTSSYMLGLDASINSNPVDPDNTPSKKEIIIQEIDLLEKEIKEAEEAEAEAQAQAEAPSQLKDVKVAAEGVAVKKKESEIVHADTQSVINNLCAMVSHFKEMLVSMEEKLSELQTKLKQKPVEQGLEPVKQEGEQLSWFEQMNGNEVEE